MRILRAYIYRAKIDHWCDRCCRYIAPGELYEGMVVILGKGRLAVFKIHINPSCDFPPDPDFDYEKSKQRRRIRKFKWRLAA